MNELWFKILSDEYGMVNMEMVREISKDNNDRYFQLDSGWEKTIAR